MTYLNKRILKWMTFWVLTLSILLSISHFAQAFSVSSDANPNQSSDLNNANCLNCHADTKAKINASSANKNADDEKEAKRVLKQVKSAHFDKGVHAKMTCVTCHTNIKDNAEINNQHQKSASETKIPDCASCHTKLWDEAQKNGKTKDQPRLGLVAEKIKSHKDSIHARQNSDDETRLNANCSDCHNAHDFNVPPKDSPERAQWRLEISNTCGTKCHEDQLETYKESSHGQEIFDKQNAKAAVCSDCHDAHAVKGTSAAPVKLSITEQCGSCHKERYKTYKATYHGQITTLGYANTAKCFDCHGSHGILGADNPDSKIHKDNRLATCRECHNPKKGLSDAPIGFVSFEPHGYPDFDKHFPIWAADQLMKQLLIGTFGFFWLHTILWFFREFKERKQLRSMQHVKIDSLDLPSPAKYQGKHFERFSLTWRIAHFLFAISLMILTLTGIPLFYPDAPWAKPVMSLLGGPTNAGIIHRINAVLFSGVFFWHLFYMGAKIAKNWKEFKIFGPNSLIPGIQDAKDMLAMFKWFFGLAPRPVFDRWTYWEKFDYWAPFWGVTIIGVSGLIMWLPSISGKFLPGWAFNVAAIFHSEEAFLAVVFLFTVHFFNNHFRPDKFPLERVMFTGAISLEELMHDHPLQYKRLVESGELEKHLVDPPSPSMMKFSTALGFILIVLGLMLLTLVGIGFFGSL